MNIISLVGSPTVKNDIAQTAVALGKTLVQSIENKAIPDDVKPRLASFHQRMKQLMIYRKNEWPYEYEFWKTHHGL